MNNVGTLPPTRSRRATAAAAAHYLGFTWVVNRMPRRPALIVLMYHRIGDASTADGDPEVISADADTFERQISFLTRSSAVVGLDEGLAHLNNPRSRTSAVLITFDDGYLDNYTVAYPILRAAGVPATFFLTTTLVGSSTWPWWDRIAYAVRNTTATQIRLGDGPVRIGHTMRERSLTARRFLRRYKALPGAQAAALVGDIERGCGVAAQPGPRRFLNWNEAREMRAGGMDIGAHTHTHPVLSRIPADVQFRELSESRRILQERLECVIDTVAYPVGDAHAFDETTVQAARAAGYRAAFKSEVDGFNRAHGDAFRLSRIAIDQLTPELMDLRVGVIATTGRLHV